MAINPPTRYNWGKAFTASDTVDFVEPNGDYPDALWVGGAGNLTLVLIDGSTLALVAVPAGTLVPIQHKRVNAAGLTASNLISLFSR